MICSWGPFAVSEAKRKTRYHSWKCFLICRGADDPQRLAKSRLSLSTLRSDLQPTESRDLTCLSLFWHGQVLGLPKFPFGKDGLCQLCSLLTPTSVLSLFSFCPCAGEKSAKIQTVSGRWCSSRSFQLICELCSVLPLQCQQVLLLCCRAALHLGCNLQVLAVASSSCFDQACQ